MTTPFDYKVKILKNSNQGGFVSCAHIGISLNNARHGGLKLDALLTWASQKYAQVQLDIYDDIHAYNIQLEKNISYEEAILLARKMGDKWIEKNHSILSKFPNLPLNRFKDLSNSRTLEKQLHELHDLYKSNALFADLIDHDINSFIIRLENRGEKISREKKGRILDLSRKYILAELALMSLLNEQQDFVEIYAGQFLTILNNPRRLLIKELPEGLKHYPIMEVDFLRKHERSGSQIAA